MSASASANDSSEGLLVAVVVAASHPSQYYWAVSQELGRAAGLAGEEVFCSAHGNDLWIWSDSIVV